MLIRSALRTVYSLPISSVICPRIACIRLASTSTKLPSQTENARSNLSKSLTARIDKLQTSILFAGQRLNDLTGYSGIETLKKQIEEQERKVSCSVEQVKDAKDHYRETIRTRSESQKEVNELLQRKHLWSSADLERFTILFRDDHSNSQNEEAAQKALAEAEIQADQTRTDLGNMILARYHEEQIWSDKIRRASTWGTWGLMVFNIFLFVIVQLGLEPWKRRRLVGSFEEKVRQMVQEERVALELVAKAADGAAPVATDSAGWNGQEQAFLTDADHAASTLDHQANRLGFESSEIDAPEVPIHNVQQDAVTRPTDLTVETERPPESPEENDKRAGSSFRPLAGTSAALLGPMSMHTLRASADQVVRHLKIHTISIFRQAAQVWRQAFSSERSALRIEDVTAACFASGVIGVGIGILLGS